MKLHLLQDEIRQIRIAVDVLPIVDESRRQYSRIFQYTKYADDHFGLFHHGQIFRLAQIVEK